MDKRYWRGSANVNRCLCNGHDMEERTEDLQVDYLMGIPKGEKRQRLIQDVSGQEAQLGNGTENFISGLAQKLVNRSQ